MRENLIVILLQNYIFFDKSVQKNCENYILKILKLTC